MNSATKPSYSNESHRHQIREKSSDETRPVSGVSDTTEPTPTSAEYQQLLTAYRQIRLERDMLRKALRAFHLSKVRPKPLW